MISLREVDVKVCLSIFCHLINDKMACFWLFLRCFLNFETLKTLIEADFGLSFSKIWQMLFMMLWFTCKLTSITLEALVTSIIGNFQDNWGRTFFGTILLTRAICCWKNAMNFPLSLKCSRISQSWDHLGTYIFWYHITLSLLRPLTLL